MTQVHAEQPKGTIVKTSVETTVPNDDIACLMYYIKCVDGVIDLSELESDLFQRLIDYRNYRRVKANRADLEELYRLCLIYTPERLFQAKAFVLVGLQNEFFKINQRNESLDIGGSVKKIIGMMTVTQSWINENYIIPMSHRIKPWAQELFGCTESIPHCLCGFCCPWCYVGEDFELIH